MRRREDVPRLHSARDNHNARHHRRNYRQNKVLPNAPERRTPPRQHRPNARQKQQEQPYGNRDTIVVIPVDRYLVPLEILRQLREERSPKHRKARRQQHQVVEQETRLPRHQRFDLVVGLQMIVLQDIGEQTHRQHNHQEYPEPVPDGRLRKGMHRTHQSRARQQSSHNRQHESDKDQPHVPRLHHAALFLHHHRMQKRRPGQPWHQRRIFHRIPSPVAAPAQNRISPMRTHKDADCQEQPRHHRPAPRNVDPLLTRIPHHQRAQRKRERNREAHIPQIQQRRVHHHLGILQQRIQSKSIRMSSRRQRKRHGRKIQKKKEENLHSGQNGRGICRQLYVHLVPHPQHKPVACKQQRPQQQRAFLPRPKRSKLVSPRQRAVRVVQDIRDPKIIRKSAPDQCESRAQNRNEGPDSRPPSRLRQPFRRNRAAGAYRNLAQRNPARQQRINAQSKSEQKSETTKGGHRGNESLLSQNKDRSSNSQPGPEIRN